MNSIKGFFDHHNLFENLQMAKDYLVKRYAEESNKKVSELSQEEKNKVLNDPKFNTVQDIFRMKEWKKKDADGKLTTPPDPMPLDQNYLNYIPFFTKFYYEQNAQIGVLESLLDLLKKYKKNLDIDLPMKVQDYTKIYSFKNKEQILDSIKNDKKFKNKSEEEIKEEYEKRIQKLEREGVKFERYPGYEKLIDDLNGIEGNIALRKLYSTLQSRMKAEFKQATPEQLEMLKTAALILNTKEPKFMDVRDEVTHKVKQEFRDPWKDFEKDTGQYENKRGTYVTYNDPKIAFKTMAERSVNFAKYWGVEAGKNILVDKIENELGARAGILYYDDVWFVASARNHEAVLTLMPTSKVCTRDERMFWSYNEGKIQLLVWNVTKSDVDPTGEYSLTVDNDFIVGENQDRKNEGDITALYIGKSLSYFLKGIGLPENAISEIYHKFPTEMKIKLCLELIYHTTKSGGSKDRIEHVISSLIGVIRGAEQGTITRDNWLELSSAVSSITVSDEKLSYSNFIKYYSKNGIVSTAGLEVFNTVVKENYTGDQINEIYEASVKSFKSIEQNMKFASSRFATHITEEDKKSWSKSLENKDYIIKQLESKLTK
jgi:hypothetical protein